VLEKTRIKWLIVSLGKRECKGARLQLYDACERRGTSRLAGRKRFSADYCREPSGKKPYLIGLPDTCRSPLAGVGRLYPLAVTL
jgi:hypothetical protein